VRADELGVRGGVQRNRSLAFTALRLNPNVAKVAIDKMNFFMTGSLGWG
jgi:hypothetical protein